MLRRILHNLQVVVPSSDRKTRPQDFAMSDAIRVGYRPSSY